MLGALIVVIALIAVTAVSLQPTLLAGRPSGPDSSAGSSPEFATQAAAPVLALQPTGPGYVDMIDPRWASETAGRTGIPRLALLALLAPW